MVSSACPQTHGLFSDLRQYLFWSQVFLLQDAPGGTSLPWSQHSPHLVNHRHALLLAANGRERDIQSFPQASVSRIQVLLLSRSTLFFCLYLAPTNNPNQTLPPQMCAGKKQKSVKHGTTPQPLYSLGSFFLTLQHHFLTVVANKQLLKEQGWTTHACFPLAWRKGAC